MCTYVKSYQIVNFTYVQFIVYQFHFNKDSHYTHFMRLVQLWCANQTMERLYKKKSHRKTEENFLKLIKSICKTSHQTLKKSHNKSPFANKTSDWKHKWHHREAEHALAGHRDLGRQLGALVAWTIKPLLDPRVLSNRLDEWLRYHLPVPTQHTCTIQFCNSTNKTL